MNYFIIEEDTTVDESIEIKEIPENINKRAILLGELQFIDKKAVEIELTESSGDFRPDLCDYIIPMFSNKLKEIMDKQNIDSIFYKPIYLVDNLKCKKDLYWLSIADKIDCIDWEKSEYEEGISLPTLLNFKIIAEKVGRYKIFKLKGVTNEFFIVTEELKKVIENNEAKGIIFTNVNDYDEF